jgi:hypothetical protein
VEGTHEGCPYETGKVFANRNTNMRARNARPGNHKDIIKEQKAKPN